MFLAFVAAMGGIGLEDVAVADFEVLQDSGFVDDAGTAVVGECAEKNGVFAVSGVNTHSKVGRSLIQKWATRESMQS